MKLIMITGLASSGPLRFHQVGLNISSFAEMFWTRQIAIESFGAQMKILMDLKRIAL